MGVQRCEEVEITGYIYLSLLLASSNLLHSPTNTIIMTQKVIKNSGQKGGQSSGGNASLSVMGVLQNFGLDYVKNTPKKLKIIDAYLLYIFITGVIQFAYCLLVGTFPFNSFLSGFISCVGSFVLGVCIRLQSNPQNKTQFDSISPERGFADFIFAHVILHLVVVNFIG